MPESFGSGAHDSLSDIPGAPFLNGAAGGEDANFFERVVRYLNNDMSDSELSAFNKELEADPVKRDIFVRACLTQAAVSEELSTQYQLFRTSLGPYQQRQPEIPSPARDAPLPLRSAPSRRRWAVAAAVVALAGVSAAITISLRSHPHLSAVIPSFANVSNSYHARWQRGPNGAGGLPAQEELSLSSGWAEITYTTGTKVTIIGPATFTMESPTHLNLQTGRLTATVSGKNFVLLTPDARIADLGTEFGASVLDRTEFAVFTGKVEANSRRDPAAANRRVLTAGDVAGITADRVDDGAQQAWPQLFPRRLPADVKSLSVSDLLSGGDGTTARQGAALDVGTGVWTYDGRGLTPRATAGDHSFHQVARLPAVAGCFVPDGPTVIDSAGHVFDFSHTANTSYNQLRIGGIIPWLREDPHRMRSVLGGTDYASHSHSLVEFQSNKGVTLDLEELRSMHPDVVLGEFRAIVGNSFPKHLGGATSIAKSGIYLLVDGQIRFQRPQFSNQDPPAPVIVPIQAGDRFLTIAVTDGGDGLDGDWILFGDPEIALGATGATP